MKRSRGCRDSSKVLFKVGNKASWEKWEKGAWKDRRIGDVWPELNEYLTQPSKATPTEGKPEDDVLTGYKLLAFRMRELKTGATWATIFSGAAWSLLNVHRDTLRELGLFLEDLYSWTPRELRSVVLENILAQDQITRRTVVDRWFNRTDYRRSQVLSLLAANIFRPWLKGEEPFGDEEVPSARATADRTANVREQYFRSFNRCALGR